MNRNNTALRCLIYLALACLIVAVTMTLGEWRRVAWSELWAKVAGQVGMFMLILTALLPDESAARLRLTAVGTLLVVPSSGFVIFHAFLR